jgi:hypothetical protein
MLRTIRSKGQLGFHCSKQFGVAQGQFLSSHLTKLAAGLVTFFDLPPAPLLLPHFLLRVQLPPIFDITRPPAPPSPPDLTWKASLGSILPHIRSKNFPFPIASSFFFLSLFSSGISVETTHDTPVPDPFPLLQLA